MLYYPPLFDLLFWTIVFPVGAAAITIVLVVGLSYLWSWRKKPLSHL